MKFAVISDIHSNLEALKKSVSLIKQENVDDVLCLGDIIGYGANPRECIDIIKELTIATVGGNHDFGVVGKTKMESWSNDAITAVHWTRSILDDVRLKFIEHLPYSYRYHNKLFVHASPVTPPQWNYIFTKHKADEAFTQFDEEICFIGHSHQPIIWTENDSQFYPVPNKDITLRPTNRYIINVGSVGQPRDGDKRGAFVIFNEENFSIKFIRFEYPISKTQNKILDAGLPGLLAKRLELGR